MTLSCAALVLGVALAPWVVPLAPLTWLACALLAAALGAAHAHVARLLAGLALGLLACASLPEGPTLLGPVSLHGVTAGAPQGRVVDLRVVRRATLGHPWVPATGRVRVRLPWGERAPPPGTEVLVHGRARPIEHQGMLPGEPDPVRAARRARIHTLVEVERWRILGPAVHPRAPAGDRTGLLAAVTTGDRSGLADTTRVLLRRTGTSHLLAISGFHVGVVAGLLGGAALWLTRRAAIVVPAGLPSWPGLAIAVIGAGAYVVAAGAPTSALRALGLLALAALGRASGRRVDPLRLLALTAATLALLDPPSVGTASFQLSFGAVWGLIRVTPWCLRWLPPDTPWPVQWVCTSLAATAGATVGTLPAVAWWFQEIAPASPVANLVAIPWMGVVIVPLAAVATWGPTAVAGVAGTVGSVAVDALLWVLGHLDHAPLVVAVGPLGAAALVVPLVVPWRWTAGMLWVAAALALRPVPATTILTFADVGQGDCTLVEHRDGRRWLVDGGRPGTGVLRWLRRRGIRHLDVVVATHGEADHIGGLPPVLEALRVDALWHGTSDGLEELVALASARGAAIDPHPALAHHPPPGFTGSANDGSLTLLVEGVLLPGDLERAGEALLVDSGAPLHEVRVIKMPHHGSRTSSTPRLLDAMSPILAVASAGRDNRFGHPAPDVVARYLERGVEVARTDLQGTVQLALYDDELRSRTHRAGVGWSAWQTVRAPSVPGSMPRWPASSPRGAPDRRTPPRRTARGPPTRPGSR